MKELEKAVLETLIYFDIFSFPLQAEEVHRYCRIAATGAGVATALSNLVNQNLVVRTGRYYLLSRQNDWIERRERNRDISVRKLGVARRNAALISQFPFVRGVAVSGSLSKYSADEQADIDFFIITEAGRLWICRGCLHLFKKLTFLLGRQHGFCMNFFLDQKELELKDKNMFTALESVTIIPVYGRAALRAFFAGNPWLTRYFPNQRTGARLADPVDESVTMGKKMLEALFPGRWGDWLNRWMMWGTVQWWRYKFRRRGYPPDLFQQAMRSTPGESKYHPNDYQQTVLAAYSERMRRYARALGWEIDNVPGGVESGNAWGDSNVIP